MKIAITGATGFVGSHLVEKLTENGQEILVLTRNPERAKLLFPSTKFPNIEIIACQTTESGAWQQAISGCDAIVNLAGEPIAERWTPEHKKAILESRQLGTRKVVEAISQASPKPAVLVNASAIGYYGTSETATFAENSPPSSDFLAQVCQAWEAEAEKVREFGVRLAILRFGIVLGKGGALARMIPPFKLFAGGTLGNGRQWFSWIHLEDITNLIWEILQRPELEGTFNATTANPVRMKEVCQTLGEVLNRPSWLPVPEFALELLLGEAAKVVLEGQQVLPKRLQAAGFQYQYPTLKSALTEIVYEL
jgi:uncharacterized protein (TIGR01777 family)